MAYPIKGFNPTTFIDWDGKLASVIYLAECNFRCQFCHSYSLVLNPHLLPDIPFEKIERFLKEKEGWIDAVVVAGGEPTIHNELESLLKEIKNHKLLVKLDTNGTNPGVLKKLIDARLVDYIAMDIKAPLEEKKYRQLAGAEVNIDDLKSSIGLLMKGVIDYEFRTTVVPDFLTRADIIEIAKAISGAKKYVLQQFDPKDVLNKSLGKIKPYDMGEFKKIAQLMKEFVTVCVVRGR